MSIKMPNVTATGHGNKYVFHPEQIKSLLSGGGHSVISATIAPTNKCNLHCSYCNQDNRSKSISLSMEKIKEFVNALKSRGLEGVVLSGGGEPTRYDYFNELVNWLKIEKDLSLGLITNGTNNRGGKEMINTWDSFDWIRVSLNFVNNQLLKLKVPNNKDGKVGMSFIYTNQTQGLIEQIAKLAEEYRARFVRIIPDYNKTADEAKEAIEQLEEMTKNLDNREVFVIQNKRHIPVTNANCHVAKVKAFICADGSVAPCDSWMNISDKTGNKFGGVLPEHFNLAKNGIGDYLDFLDGKRGLPFTPLKDCNGCSYTVNNEILDHLFTLRAKHPQASVTELFEMLGIKLNSEIKDVNFI